MSRFLELRQGSIEWHQWRKAGIGGSDIAALLGLAPYADATPDRVFAEKTVGKVNTEPNWAMKRGHMLEPQARDLYARRANRYPHPVCVEHDDAPWIRASLDGWDSIDQGVIEVKCCDWMTHDLALEGIVRADHRAQCQWQMLAAGTDWCDYVSYNPSQKFAAERQMAVIRIEADSEEQAKILEVAEQFWERVIAWFNGNANPTTFSQPRNLPVTSA